MAATAKKRPDARQRLIETAERLFYAEGIRSVGIDRIIAEAGVAKMTLYNHFKSKDELILAVLKYREQLVDEMFAESVQRQMKKGKTYLEAFFVALKEWFRSPGFRGCSFINASVELADPNHPASKFAAQHKRTFYIELRKKITEATGGKTSVADAIILLVEGAIVTAVMQQSSKPADTARDVALSLVSQAEIH